MDKVIIFGAGEVGIKAFYEYNETNTIVAFVDNDVNKWGKKIKDLLVLKPAQLKEFKYNKIYIASLAREEIYNQLTNDLGIEPSIIEYYPIDINFDARLAYLRSIADEIKENNIQGSIAELGVFKGEFAKHVSRNFETEKFYLFDTFEGFDERDVLAEVQLNYSNASSGEYFNNDINLVLDKLYNNQRCIVKKGYFPETFEGVTDEFVFVSIDVDLYLPIYEGLKAFYPRMKKGGYILIHDYNSVRFTGAKEAVKKYCRETGARYMPLNDISGSVVIIK